MVERAEVAAVEPTVGNPVLDHLVLAGPDLAAAVAWVAERVAVTPVRGGSHVGRGTANELLGLGGGAYLEIVGPDPDQPDPEGPRPFGVDTLAMPRLVTWAVRTTAIDTLVRRARDGGYDPGDPQPMSRATPDGTLLEWRLTPPDSSYGHGLVPFLIDWGTTSHPTTRALPEVRLRSLRATHPDPASVRPALVALCVDLHLEIAEHVSLSAVLDGPGGPVVL